ncbi:hypothetical protein EMCRGX_G013982 [Ephydatia muelleri]
MRADVFCSVKLQPNGNLADTQLQWIDLKCSVNHLFRPDNDNTHHTGEGPSAIRQAQPHDWGGGLTNSSLIDGLNLK